MLTDTYKDLFSTKFHYVGRFIDTPNNTYIDGEFSYVDMVSLPHFKIDLLYWVLCSLGFDDDDVINLYYNIPLKSLDIWLKPLISKVDITSFLGDVHKHKVMYVYSELVQSSTNGSDEDREGDSESDSEDGISDDNELIDEEYVVDEVEVNMDAFNYQTKDRQVDPILPIVTLTEDD